MYSVLQRFPYVTAAESLVPAMVTVIQFVANTNRGLALYCIDLVYGRIRELMDSQDPRHTPRDLVLLLFQGIHVCDARFVRATPTAARFATRRY